MLASPPPGGAGISERGLSSTAAHLVNEVAPCVRRLYDLLHAWLVRLKAAAKHNPPLSAPARRRVPARRPSALARRPAAALIVIVVVFRRRVLLLLALLLLRLLPPAGGRRSLLRPLLVGLVHLLGVVHLVASRA